MSLTPTSYSQAEYLDSAPAINAPERPDSSLFVRALLFGIAGALVGAALNAAVLGLLHINIGYLAIVVAWLVAKAMVTGSRGQGGRYYQIAAVVLTYLAVAASRAALWFWMQKSEGESVPISAQNVLAAAKYGLLAVFTRVSENPVSGLIGLFILFIGMRAAWRMTSGDPAAVRHPFAR